MAGKNASHHQHLPGAASTPAEQLSSSPFALINGLTGHGLAPPSPSHSPAATAPKASAPAQKRIASPPPKVSGDEAKKGKPDSSPGWNIPSIPYLRIGGLISFENAIHRCREIVASAPLEALLVSWSQLDEESQVFYRPKLASNLRARLEEALDAAATTSTMHASDAAAMTSADLASDEGMEFIAGGVGASATGDDSGFSLSREQIRKQQKEQQRLQQQQQQLQQPPRGPRPERNQGNARDPGEACKWRTVMFANISGQFCCPTPFLRELHGFSNVKISSTFNAGTRCMGAICKTAADAKALLCKVNWPPTAFGGKCEVSRSTRYSVVETDPEIISALAKQIAARNPETISRIRASNSRRELIDRTVVCYNFPKDTIPEDVKADWADVVEDSFLMGSLMGVVFTTKAFADDLVKQGRDWLGLTIRGNHRTELKIALCDRCHKPDHGAQQCTAPAVVCDFCTSPHDSSQCDKTTAVRKCSRCDGPHSSRYLGCPLLQAYMKEARKRDKAAADEARGRLHLHPRAARAPQQQLQFNDVNFPALPANDQARPPPAQPANANWPPAQGNNLAVMFSDLTVTLKAVMKRLAEVERQLAAAVQGRSLSSQPDDVAMAEPGDQTLDYIMERLANSPRNRNLVAEIMNDVYAEADAADASGNALLAPPMSAPSTANQPKHA